MKLIILKLQLVLCVFLTSNVIAAEIHPNILITADQITAIQAKVGDGIQPWKDAYDKAIAQGDAALDLPLMSVTFGGIGNADNNCPNIRYFCTFSGNWYDSDNGSWPIGGGVSDLGVAYAFTGDEAYAIKIIELVKVWALDPVTGMIPRLSNNQSIISLLPAMSGLIYGVELSWDSPNWTEEDKNAFKAWAQSLGNDAVNAFGQSEKNAADNNFENWRNAFLSVAGAFTGDQNLLDRAYQNFRKAITWQLSCEGRMNQEYGRPERWGGTGYSLYAMHAMTITAEVARLQNVDLYNYTTEERYRDWSQNERLGDCGSGRGLKTALSYHAPFYAGTEPWPSFFVHGPDPLDREHGMGIYELAYSVWQDPQYLDVVNEWVRPLGTHRWPLGIVTLTHANQFDLDLVPIPPSITSQPDSISVMEGENASFSIVAIGNNPLVYQWFRDDDIIPGAISASYTLDPVEFADDKVRFHSVVTNSVGSDTSNYAELTVIADSTAPVIAGAVVQSPVQVDVVFSEAVTSASAETVANYQIDQAVGVQSASLNADNRTVHLQTDTLVADTVYTLTVNNIQDTSEAANSIVANSSIEIQFAPVMNFDNGNLPFAWIPLTESRWSVVDDNGNNALFLNTTAYDPLSGGRLGEYIISPDSYGDFTLTVEAKTNEPADNGNADYALVFGFEDSNNYYYMLFNRTRTNTELFRVVDGNRELLGAATAAWLTDDEYHTVSVRVASSSVEVRFNGGLVLEYTDLDGTISVGKIGLGSFNDSAYFDDIRISTGANSPGDLIYLDGFE